MKILTAAFALCAAAGPVLASDACADLWFTRNAIMDRAGYCFGSVLGQTVFDNAGCSGKQVALQPQAARSVAHIQALEARIGCKVDTSRRHLALSDLFLRLRLHDLPVRDEFASACLGWLGPAVPLHAGHGPHTPIVGQIAPGDYVRYGHLPVGGWTYVTTSDAAWQIRSGGWLDRSQVEERCQDVAG